MKLPGKPNKIPSILSRTPPCPGRKLPVSFNLAFLFKYEKNKSPNWQIIEVITPIKNILILRIPKKKKTPITKAATEKIKDPKAPLIVLFGLILVNFGPFKILPKINPPISEKMQANKIQEMRIFNVTIL